MSRFGWVAPKVKNWHALDGEADALCGHAIRGEHGATSDRATVNCVACLQLLLVKAEADLSASQERERIPAKVVCAVADMFTALETSLSPGDWDALAATTTPGPAPTAAPEPQRTDTALCSACPLHGMPAPTPEPQQQQSAVQRCIAIAEGVGAAEFDKNAGYCAGRAIAAEIKAEFGLDASSPDVYCAYCGQFEEDPDTHECNAAPEPQRTDGERLDWIERVGRESTQEMFDGEEVGFILTDDGTVLSGCRCIDGEAYYPHLTIREAIDTAMAESKPTPTLKPAVRCECGATYDPTFISAEGAPCKCGRTVLPFNFDQVRQEAK